MEISEWLATLIAFSTGSITGSFFAYLKHRKARKISLTVHLPLPRTPDDIEYLADAMGNIQRAMNGEPNEHLS